MSLFCFCKCYRCCPLEMSEFWMNRIAVYNSPYHKLEPRKSPAAFSFVFLSVLCVLCGEKTRIPISGRFGYRSFFARPILVAHPFSSRYNRSVRQGICVPAKPCPLRGRNCSLTIHKCTARLTAVFRTSRPAQNWYVEYVKYDNQDTYKYVKYDKNLAPNPSISPLSHTRSNGYA